jgi:predicted protein tyrosine phosphatase
LTIEFCSYDAVAERMNAGSFSALISILGRADGLEWPSVEIPHLCLPIDDIAAPMRGYSLASNAQVANLLRFGVVHNNVLIHCRAGSSRSSAAAMLLRLQSDPLPAHAIAPFVEQFRSYYPFARPNQRIIECGDAALRLDRRLIAAVKNVFT